jgi:integrase/recombinase XerC
MENSGDNVFRHVPAGEGENGLAAGYLNARDFAQPTRRAIGSDLRKFGQWFVLANHEPFRAVRVTVRDVTDFRSFLRENQKQAVATVNRCLVSVRRYFDWLVDQGHLPMNPAKIVKELRRQALAPKGLERAQVRRLLREVELRGDTRGNGIFSMMLFTGCRVSDVAHLELQDLILAERSGSVVFRFGKGGKQRSCPLPLPARRALTAYLETRPPAASPTVFIGERGALTDRGIRALCAKYSAICGFRIHPHLLRHTFSHEFLQANENDLVALAQILGHENIQTTARYCQRTQDALAEGAERLTY